MWASLLGHGYPDMRTFVTQGYEDNPLRTRISGYWSLRAVWASLCGQGCTDIGLSGLCGQPSAGTDIRTLGTQGYVDSPLWTRISGYYSLKAMWTSLLRTRISRYWVPRAMWTTLCGHGYSDIGHSGLCGQPSAATDIRTLVS